MKYFNSNDYEISYDTYKVKRYLSEGDQVLEDLAKNLNNLVMYVSNLEAIAHDKQGTRVDEDYKDFEAILGDDGLKSFVGSMETVFESIRNAMNEYERVVRTNQIRREEERRREEEERKRAEEAKFQSFRR